MATNDKSYNNQETKSIFDLPSKENIHNDSREYADTGNTHSELDMSANSEYGGRGIQEVDKGSAEKNTSLKTI